MRIGNTNSISAGTSAQMPAGTDSISRNIQNQIQKLQQDLQKLSENKDMSPDEKMKKRQEIQQQIADLNRELHQHEIDMRKEQQQSRDVSMDDMLGGKSDVHSKSQAGQSTGFSQESVQVLISAESSMKQARVQGSVATQMKGRAGVLKAEIKTDAAKGGNTAAKQKELAEIEQTAANATSRQMHALSDANAAVEKAKKAENESSKDKNTEKTSSEKNEENETVETTEEKQKEDKENYTRVDVHL